MTVPLKALSNDRNSRYRGYTWTIRILELILKVHHIDATLFWHLNKNIISLRWTDRSYIVNCVVIGSLDIKPIFLLPVHCTMYCTCMYQFIFALFSSRRFTEQRKIHQIGNGNCHIVSIIQKLFCDKTPPPPTHTHKRDECFFCVPLKQKQNVNHIV